MTRTLLILNILFGLTATGQVAQGGYFDYEKVIVELPEYSLSQKEIETLKIKLEDSIDILVSQYRNLLEFYSGDRYWDSILAKTVNDSITRLLNNINICQESALDRLRNEEISIQEYLNNQMKKHLQYFCMVNKFDFNAEKEALHYCYNCIDLTDELIKYLRELK